jgi:hypothetical protein
MIRLSKHAQERVDAGEVQREWIETAILHPDRTRPDLRRPDATSRSVAYRSLAAGSCGLRIVRMEPMLWS